MKKNNIFNLCYISINLSIAIIILGLSYIFPLSSILFMIIGPLSGCLIASKVNKRYQAIFVVCLFLVSFIEIQSGLFYLLPNTIVGLIYGNFKKKNCSKIVTCSVFLLATFLFSFLAVFPIWWIFEVDQIKVYSVFLNIRYEVFKTIYPLFVLFLCSSITSINYDIVEEETKKFIVPNEKQNDFTIGTILGLLFYMITILCYILHSSLAFLFAGLTFIYIGISIIYLCNYCQKILKIVLLSAAAIIQILLFFILVAVKSIDYMAFAFIFSNITWIIADIFIIIYEKCIKKRPINNLLFVKDND